MFYSGSQGMPWLDFDAMDDRLLGRCLRRQAEAIPDADFLVEDDVHYGFGRSNELANAYAAGFRELGVGRGDTVALFAKSGSELVFSALGLNKLGAIWVPTNTDYKGAWLRETFEDSRAKLLVADAELLPRVAELGELPFERIAVRGGEPEAELGVPTLPLAALADRHGPEPDDNALYYGDTAAILWTSGTTGRSKGVMQSHSTWIKAAVNGALTAGLQEGDVLYSCLPMYNSAAWVANVFRALVTGVPCGIDSQFSAGAFWDRTRHYGATMCFTLGAMHMFLWNAPERPDDADNPVRVFSAIPLPAALEEPFKKRFGIESVFQGYGQSELMTVLARTPGEAWKPNSLGEPQAGVEVALLDDDDLPVTTGETGELCARPTEPFALFNGYWGDPEATVRAWRNLWYHSGDLMRQDEDGEFFFVDRKADFIRFKGRNLSSFAVEAAVMAHPAVAQAAAHGVTAEELESEAEMKVCVVCKPGERVDAEALARFVNDNAPHFFVPRYIEFLEALPQTPTGRVQKFKLRERGVTPQTWDARAEGFEIQR
ncbi:MAG: AMP-binding protein [Deltaproteobacteria bacterium]|nr:AMP-binding protein [Deltaproteobacteria bacterium]